MKRAVAMCLAVLLATSCSSATAVRDVDADMDEEVDSHIDEEPDPEAEYFGWLLLDETDDPQLLDFVGVAFHTRLAQERAERCNYMEDLPVGECRVVAPPDGPPGFCEEDCTICGLTEDCSAWECSTGDSRLLAEAGDVSISGGTRPSYTCVEEPGTFWYSCDVSSASSFDPGDILEISAPGGSFPAFEFTTEVLPRPHLTNDTGTWTTATFDGSRDVSLEWSGARPASRMEITLNPHTGEHLQCVTEDDGRFVLTAETIAEVSGTLVSQITIVMTRVNETTIRPTAESEFTARLISSVNIDVSR